MGVYNNNKDGTRTTIANTIQVVNAPMEQFLSRGEFSAVTPNDVSADNKLIDFAEFNTTLKELALIEDIDQYHDDPEAVFVTGAVGDGVTDDSQAFIDAITKGYTLSTSPKIIIPSGKYNLNHEVFDSSVITNSITFIGESAHLCELINANISAQYGITCKNVAFIGGTQRNFSGNDFDAIGYNFKQVKKVGQEYEHDAEKEPYVAILCTPAIQNVVIEYKNCIFKNTTAHKLDAASIAYRKTNPNNYSIQLDDIENCLFEDITYTGIYHRMPIQYGKYCNNIFRNFGDGQNSPTDPSKDTAPKAQNTYGCIKLGDTTNNSGQVLYVVGYAVIENNIFDTMNSYEVADSTTKTGEYNFVTLRGDGVIFHNQFKNLKGYGRDREGFYSKGDTVEIRSNYFENAGLGEGYICNKHIDASVVRNVSIYDNVIIGDAGRAIRQYCDADIRNNYICIQNAKQAIDASVGSSDGENHTVSICNNYIYCGFTGEYRTKNGQVVEDYHSKNSSQHIRDYVVEVSGYSMANACDNTIMIYDAITNGTSSDYNCIILVHFVTNYYSTIFNNNRLYSNNCNIGFQNYMDATYEINNVTYPRVVNGSHHCEIKNNLIDLNNTFTSGHNTIPLKIVYIPTTIDSINCVVKDNIILNSQYASNGLDIQLTNNGKGILEFDTQKHNNTWADEGGKYVKYTNVSYINTPNQSWIKT